MEEKIIDPRLFEIRFEEEKIPLFIVPSRTNKGTSRYIKKKLANRFSAQAEINEITYNLYFSLSKNKVPNLIDFVKDSDYIKALEIDDFSREGIEDNVW